MRWETTVYGILWGRFEQWKETKNDETKKGGELIEMCQFLWRITDPSPVEQDRFDIFNTITKLKGGHPSQMKLTQLNQFENLLFEFNSRYCKYAIRELDEKVRQQDDRWLDASDEMWRMSNQLEMVTHKLEQEENKNQELHAAFEAEKKKNEALYQEIVKERTAAFEGGRRANMQGLLLQLESMGERLVSTA